MRGAGAEAVERSSPRGVDAAFAPGIGSLALEVEQEESSSCDAPATRQPLPRKKRAQDTEHEKDKRPQIAMDTVSRREKRR